MKNKIKESYNTISISEDLEDKIINKTVKKKDKSFGFKKYVFNSLIIGLLVAGFSLTIVNADKIINMIKEWATGVSFEDGTRVELVKNAKFKEILKTAPKGRDNGYVGNMDHDTVEKVLGVDILDSDEKDNNVLGYSTYQNEDGSIARVGLWWIIKEESDDKHIAVSILMLNKGAEYRYVAAFEEGIDATGGKELNQVYELKNLNAKAVIYGNDWDKERLTMAFVYDDIYYDVIADGYTKEELISFVETLK